MSRELTPEDERAIEDAVEQRHRQAELEAQAAEAAQPKCCSLWWQKHRLDCPNRTHDAELANFWRRVKRLGWRVLKVWLSR